MPSPCESCHAGCCRAFAVPITGADVLRIRRERQLEFAEFACRWADPDGRIAGEFAPHLRFEDTPETPYVLSLLHEASVVYPESTKCRFLEETAPTSEHPFGTGTCSIYESRPQSCRCFPAKFDDAGELTVISIPEYGRDEPSPAYKLCPRPWEIADLQPRQMRRDLEDTVDEMSFFRLVADIWNRELRAWELFPEFLRLVYEERERLTPRKAA